jgi:hypothetical protein
VHELEIHGDPEEPRKVFTKYLCVVPKRFVPIAVSIESVLDTANMSIEEITGRLRAIEGRADEEDADPSTGAGGKLLLIEEEQWLAWLKDKQPGEGSSKSSDGRGGSKNWPRNQKKKSSGGKDDRNTCHNCGKKRHWAKDCRAPRKKQANLIREDDEESLLMARVSEINVNPTPWLPEGGLHLHEPMAHFFLGASGYNDNNEPQEGWYLDTGVSSHMTACRLILAA